MNNYKIRVNNEAESREARELFFALGYKKGVCTSGGYPATIVAVVESLHCDTPFYSRALSLNHDAHKDYIGLTLPQLHDLVVLHRNDIDDANWETEGDDQIYEDSSGKSFIFREQGWDELQRHEMRQAMWEKTKPKTQTTENEQGLISGADALRALADGETVEVKRIHDNEWKPAQIFGVSVFTDSETTSFRLKPCTVKLEIEVPAPFEPKHGDDIWFLNPDYGCGYADGDYDPVESVIQFGAWRTEAEIKIVVEQLRKLKEYSK
ncbi:hypothetical protein EA748_08035 [Acinetobacter ursingii]|uniref:hypothetical protein n=1 Tax=Acinetobacter ursingii TaxID=108980 RepID=UPI000F78FDDE|nr:hypothetical protein [Acinetobacter ursingii]RSO82891.1 hypothetical protein EA748_08035 [Acinetobacter ursingii]